MRRAQRRSRHCSQAGPLPNLRARIAGAEATPTPGVQRYLVRAANAGSAAAQHVGVTLEVDGFAVDTKTVPRLAPGEAQVIEFRGPRCGSSVLATADPDDTVRESSEDDNSQSLTCAQLPH